MQHSMKMMWLCVAGVAAAIVFAATGYGFALLFVVPCMAMMAMMMWMMMGGGRRSGDK